METKIMSPEEIATGVAVIVKAGSHTKKYEGNCNYGKPKSNYLSLLVQMSDDQLFEECKSKIWLSAFANNNHRSDYHWHCDASYEECHRREKGEIYTKAHAYVSKNN